MDLGLDEDALSACVQCGLCLSACPTYRVTGDETRSPRGRIALMREVQRNDAPLAPEIIDAFSSCIQCRACEPACPSGVQYGHLMERTRQTLDEQGVGVPFVVRIALSALRYPRLVRLGSVALALIQRIVPLPRRLGLPERLPLRRETLVDSGDDVILFTGCVMDAWQRDIHAAAKRVIERAGFGVRVSGASAPCCGALHTHTGLGGTAREIAEQVIGALDGDRPILVDAAGCGAALKDYGELLGTPEAHAFAGRVRDVQEWLAEHVDRLPSPDRILEERVAIQDPCHLRHVQRVHEATRSVLRPFVTALVELDDDGMCCGAGGAFSVLEPELAGAVRDRKVAAIARSAPTVVASANPGCALYLAAEGIPTVHPMQLIDRALTPGGAVDR
jgi:glycolate oxidase iron-sulfur subunit